MKKALLLLAILVSVHSQLAAQTIADVKSKMGISQQSEYAKAHQLLQQSDIMTQAVNGHLATLFLVPNIAFEGMPIAAQQPLFAENNQQAIANPVVNINQEPLYHINISAVSGCVTTDTFLIKGICRLGHICTECVFAQR